MRKVKAFYDIRIALHKACSKRHLCGHSSIIASPNMTLPRLKPMIRSSDTYCWIWPLTISSKKQLVSSKESKSLIWHSNNHIRHVLRVVHVGRATLLHPDKYEGIHFRNYIFKLPLSANCKAMTYNIYNLHYDRTN